MNNNLFIGDHGTEMINLDNVERVTAPACIDTEQLSIEVYYVSGRLVVMTYGNARMFLAAWRRRHALQEVQAKHQETNFSIRSE